MNFKKVIAKSMVPINRRKGKVKKPKKIFVHISVEVSHHAKQNCEGLKIVQFFRRAIEYVTN